MQKIIRLCLALVLFLMVTVFFAVSAAHSAFLEGGVPSYCYYILSLAMWAAIARLLQSILPKKRVMITLLWVAVPVVGGLYPVCFNKLSSVFYWHHLISEGIVYSAQTERPLVAITFDDGPEDGRTEALLDVLRAHGAHASFFIVGSKVAGREGVVRRMVEEGHSVGNHSWSHHRFRDISYDNLVQEITETNAAISTVTGHPVAWIRPPGGDMTFRQYLIIRRHFEQAVCMWDSSTADFAYQGDSPTDVIVPRTMRLIRPGSILLAHDHALKPETLDALLSAMEDKGYQCVSISELLQGDSRAMVPSSLR